MTKIRDITQKDGGDFYRFSIVDADGKFYLHMEEKKWTDTYKTHLTVVTSAKRLEELANDILNHLGKKVKWEEWKPTMDDLEARLEELHHGLGLEFWFIDMIRTAMVLQHESKIKQVRHIYEWLKSNEDWLYGKP